MGKKGGFRVGKSGWDNGVGLKVRKSWRYGWVKGEGEG